MQWTFLFGFFLPCATTDHDLYPLRSNNFRWNEKLSFRCFSENSMKIRLNYTEIKFSSCLPAFDNWYHNRLVIEERVQFVISTQFLLFCPSLRASLSTLLVKIWFELKLKERQRKQQQIINKMLFAKNENCSKKRLLFMIIVKF